MNEAIRYVKIHLVPTRRVGMQWWRAAPFITKE